MLEVELSGLRLKNPLMLASGILGVSVESLNEISEDVGAVVTKSVGIEGRKGYRNPCVLNWSCGIVNAVGLESPPAEVFREELSRFNGKSALIVSLYGSEPEDFSRLVRIFDTADAFELNLSCPHAKGLGLEVGSDPELVKDIVRSAKSSTEKPVFVKISPHVDVVEIGKACEEAGADGLVAINTLRGMLIDVMSRRPILSNLSGGVSGDAIKPIAVKCVWDLYEEVDIPIIGCGGIRSWRDAVEFMLAGARCVQIGSAVYLSKGVFRSIAEGIRAYLRLFGESIEDIIGAAHRS